MDANTMKHILEGLEEPKDLRTEPKVVTVQGLQRWANFMATKKGYRHSLESLEALEKYAQGYALLLTGSVGTGKTFFFQSLGQNIEIVSLATLAGWKLDDIQRMLDNNRDYEVVFDDIGAEPAISDFGVKQEILPLILERRQYCRKRTHFTTNLSAQEIEERYGVRSIDRIYGMTYPITFTGESKRDCKPFEET